MAKIDLEKRAEKVRIVLEKKNIKTVPPTRVGLALDISGSTRGMYHDGVMQEAVNRLQAVAMRFDDNKELDMWSFSNGFNRLVSATPNDCEDYVERRILNDREVDKWHGTSYAPVMEDILEFYFKGEVRKAGGLFGLFGKTQRVAPANANVPAMCLFVTDGANDDRRQAAEVLRRSQDKAIYWQLIGVGPAREFGFIREMADELPNVGFVNLSSLSMSDEALYDQLLNDELCGWVKGR